MSAEIVNPFYEPLELQLQPDNPAAARTRNTWVPVSPFEQHDDDEDDSGDHDSGDHDAANQNTYPTDSGTTSTRRPRRSRRRQALLNVNECKLNVLREFWTKKCHRKAKARDHLSRLMARGPKYQFTRATACELCDLRLKQFRNLSIVSGKVRVNMLMCVDRKHYQVPPQYFSLRDSLRASAGECA